MSIRIGLSMAGFPFSAPKSFLDWIELCEGSDLDSVWFSERLVSKQPTMEPMTVMSVVAGRTSRLKFGMNAIVLPLRDPLVLAKECATLDFLSGGRLLPVFGVGSELAPEFRATGRALPGRGAIADEMLDIMVRLWSEEGVTHEGKHFQYHEVSISPKPVQQPLPLWIGGSSEAAIRRTARIGTGWLAGLEPPSRVAPIVAGIKEAAAAAGRTIDEDHFGAGFSFRFGSADDPLVERTAAALSRIAPGADGRSLLAVGGAHEIIAKAREYADAGISKFVLSPISAGDEDRMDQTRRLIDEVLPIVHAPAFAVAEAIGSGQ